MTDQNPLKALKTRLFDALSHNDRAQSLISGLYSRKTHDPVERRECWGTDYPDKTFYVIRRKNDWGLISFLQCVWSHIVYAQRRGYIPVVDMGTVHNIYIADDQLGRGLNPWEDFFLQPGGYTMQDIRHAKNVVISGFFILQDTRSSFFVDWQIFDAATFFDPRRQQYWYEKARGTLRLTAEAQRYIEQKGQEIFGAHTPDEVLGVFCRGTDYADLRPALHPVQPPVEEVLQTAKEWMEQYGLKACYLVTEDERICERFVTALGRERVLYNTGARRTGAPRDAQDWIYRRDQGTDLKKNGMDYLANMMLFTRCDYMMGGIAGGVIGFMLINPKQFKKTKFWDLGLYPETEQP